MFNKQFLHPKKNKRKNLVWIYISLLLSLILNSCIRDNDKLENALSLAGNNRQELETVINHYKKTGEKEKVKACIFLIENMPGHVTYKGELLDKVEFIYNKIVHLYNNGNDNFHSLDSIVKHNYDSIIEWSGTHLIYDLENEKDIQTLKSNYLIENIDHAFYMWKNMPWAYHVTFDQFCELILPYRVYTEPLSNWRKKLSEKYISYSNYLKDPTDPVEFCKLLNDSIYPSWKHLDNIPNVFPSIVDLDTFRGGTCEHHYLYMTAVYRSLGIAACIDKTPQNNEWKVRHSWLAVLDKNGEIKKYNPGEPHSNLVTNVPLGKGGATTVYRNTYSSHKLPFQYELDATQIPEFFMNYNQVDVTNEYSFPKIDITINIESSQETPEYIFLCAQNFAFDLRAVAVSEVKNGKAKYKNLGIPACYFPAYFENNQLTYCGNPVFYLTDGRVKEIVPDLENTQTMTIYRKYQASDSVIVYANEMIGAKIQGSNEPDFKNATDIYEFKTSTGYFDEIKLNATTNYKYYRYLGAKNKRINIAELEFIGKKNNSDTEEKLDGSPIGFASFENDRSVNSYALDGDIRTYYFSTAGSWFGIDVHNDNAILTKIRYQVRNHFNIVEPGDFYELFYFDGKEWLSLGKKQATTNNLTYDNAPKNTLYLLKDLSQGQDERMFIYENGQQVFI